MSAECRVGGCVFIVAGWQRPERGGKEGGGRGAGTGRAAVAAVVPAGSGQIEKGGHRADPICYATRRHQHGRIIALSRDAVVRRRLLLGLTTWRAAICSVLTESFDKDNQLHTPKTLRSQPRAHVENAGAPGR